MTEGHNYYQSNKRRIWILGAAILILSVIFSVGFISKTVKAQKSIERIKLVTSVEVEKGDTLWSIASEYISDEYADMNEYIEEIRDSNNLASDEIHTGNFIIVPYYADASNNNPNY
jgi:LysM repeat protein